jgi:hypothetical protein
MAFLLTIAKPGVHAPWCVPKSSDDEELYGLQKPHRPYVSFCICFPTNILLVANNRVMNHQAIYNISFIASMHIPAIPSI